MMFHLIEPYRVKLFQFILKNKRAARLVSQIGCAADAAHPYQPACLVMLEFARVILLLCRSIARA